MKKLTISLDEAWEKILKVQATTGIAKDVLQDMDGEIDKLKRTIYELRKLEKSNAFSKTDIG